MRVKSMQKQIRQRKVDEQIKLLQTSKAATEIFAAQCIYVMNWIGEERMTSLEGEHKNKVLEIFKDCVQGKINAEFIGEESHGNTNA